MLQIDENDPADFNRVTKLFVKNWMWSKVIKAMYVNEMKSSYKSI